ncbi:3',5'-bisphosphate nucleotidase AHL-like [Nicotiana sylvestris]|uniref:3'(2'),5'-bisphosphate nucleotidase n=1 Tax=Nicotiana sylvestris TaxID=4096 RepID=A0A1U7UX77_NICSY|nr:PREDICTED: PAP-specific phosphatase HAL2-like [Nicotiana sylvestris]XP_016497735.1 PREDICTED: PAP-specific phosphatase HAL2-like [Nicotiana tabacum]
MSCTCTTTSFPIKVPHTLFHSRKSNDVFPKTQILGTLSFSSKKNSHLGFTDKISLAQCSKTSFLSEMDEDCKLEVSSIDIPDGYCKELEIAVRAVHMACLLCQRLQDNLLSKSFEQVHSKEDNSPVTIADWSVQAIVSWVLSEAFGSENVSIVAEEDVEVLSKASAVGLLEAVVRTVNECLADAPRFGLKGPGTDLDAKAVLAAISRCSLAGARGSKFWVLDPVDGTLGFVRGDQYAIALALIEDGEPVLGVLGCPNYPMKKEWLSYQNGYRRILSRLTSQTSVSGDKGSVLYARKGGGKAWMQPLLYGEKNFVWPNSAKQIKVSSIDNPALATFCEPVEKANSSHSFTAGLAHSVGLRNQPLRVYSMVKYAAIARGDAEIFMKFASAGYKEKIWDHAAGVLIIEEAGGMVTDAGGQPLDFSKGVYLEGLDRGIIACAGAKLHEKIIQAVDASWNSSSL